MVMVIETTVSSVTVLSLLAQILYMCIYPVSEWMGKQKILEAVFQVSEVHWRLTFLIKKSNIQSTEQDLLIFLVTAPLVSNRILWHIQTEPEPLKVQIGIFLANLSLEGAYMKQNKDM